MQNKKKLYLTNENSNRVGRNIRFVKSEHFDGFRPNSFMYVNGTSASDLNVTVGLSNEQCEQLRDFLIEVLHDSDSDSQESKSQNQQSLALHRLLYKAREKHRQLCEELKLAQDEIKTLKHELLHGSLNTSNNPQLEDEILW